MPIPEDIDVQVPPIINVTIKPNKVLNVIDNSLSPETINVSVPAVASVVEVSTDPINIPVNTTNNFEVVVGENTTIANVVVEFPDPIVIELALREGIPGDSGPPGDPGIQGDPGPRGDPGPPGGTYSFAQSSPSSVWGPILHNLGLVPSVVVVDSAGTTIQGFGRQDPDLSNTSLYFAAPHSGTAYLR